ncbi:MAG: hypothetical protein ASARMPRED_003921 [Alectoria sarmentosa]|nr:MAG: hypothetical protein ASARMPRED_003921 [Alectoria sarmentosa]
MSMESGEDHIPSEYYRPLASPKAPITDDQNRPVSIVSTSARSAKVVAAPPSPTKSVNTEIHEDNPNGTIDRFDELSSEEDGGNYQDLDRFGTIPLYSKRSIKGRSVQSPSHGVRQSSSLSISQPIAVASSTGFGMPIQEPGSTVGVQPHHNPQHSDVSVQSSGNSHRFSTLEVDDSVSPRSTWIGMRAVGQAISTDLPSPAEYPPGRRSHPNISPLPSRESTIRRSFSGGFLPRPTLPSTDPSSEESNARREVGGFRLPFLHGMPKFLRPSGYAKSSLTPSEEKEVKDAAQPPGSFFHDGSSDGEPDEEDSKIDDAQQAIVGSPVLVKHGSRTKVGLKEMLHTAPLPQDNPGPSRGKAMRMLGEKIELGRKPISRDGAFPIRTPSKREGVIGMPHQEQGDTLTQDQEDQVGLGIFHTLNPFAHDGLRSHPVSPKEDPAVAPPQTKRSVSFPPAPLQLDIKPEHRFLRQDIVSTPYPPGFQGRAGSLYNASEPGTIPATNEAPKSLLTLVLYSHGDSVSKVKKIVIPTPPETALIDHSDEKSPPIKATLRRDFDDERLFKLIRSEYNSMRGSLRQLASARTVRSMNLLAYHSTSELVSKNAKPMHFRHQDNDESLAEARMLDLFKNPKRGKRHHEWVEWVTTLPENANLEPVDKERIALELVEGWSTRKLLAAVVAVLVCSLAITLLWIFLGAGGDNLGFESSDVSLPGGITGHDAGTVEHPIGYKGAGGRVETGVALGILVLMFGWTSIGAWVLLNWLVM